MKIKYLLFLIALMISTVAFSQGYADSAKINYTKEIDNYRRGINIKLLYGESTPLTAEQQKNFKGLNYFAPDMQYRVEGTLVKADKQEDVVMKTSGDRTPIYVKYGTVNFALNGKNLTLTVYQNKKMLEMVKDVNTLFIPFRDANLRQGKLWRRALHRLRDTGHRRQGDA